MLRDKLVSWLLRSTFLCRLGLHMPVLSGEIVDGEMVWDKMYFCGVCDKLLGAV